MRASRQLWPKGTGQWSRIRTVIVGATNDEPEADTVVVVTPLELIARLEAQHTLVSRVVLTSGAGAKRELATFVKEHYPLVDVVEA